MLWSAYLMKYFCISETLQCSWIKWHCLCCSLLHGSNFLNSKKKSKRRFQKRTRVATCVVAIWCILFPRALWDKSNKRLWWLQARCLSQLTWSLELFIYLFIYLFSNIITPFVLHLPQSSMFSLRSVVLLWYEDLRKDDLTGQQHSIPCISLWMLLCITLIKPLGKDSLLLSSFYYLTEIGLKCQCQTDRMQEAEGLADKNWKSFIQWASGCHTGRKRRVWITQVTCGM